MNTYISNNVVVLTVAFTLVSSGAAADPTTVVCKVKLPNGSVVDVSSTITKISTGNYTATYEPLVAGSYSYEFIGTGAVIAAGVKDFYVNPATF